ncbi:MAG: PIG-L family deacetylase [Selenomonadaceae bacterium]|nr:PIG-L family deacetylase [Selenomonadaceae bacterium]
MNDKKFFSNTYRAELRRALRMRKLIAKIFDSDLCGALALVNESAQVEEKISVGNSFFDKSYFGTRVLILAPHPDDEINIAGNMILNLAAAKAEIFVAYSTNGDFENPAAVRAAEAVDALKILGVSEDKIIFLGYGDTFNGKGNPHVFDAVNPMTSPAGFSETYAAENFIDYAKKTFGQHSPYTREYFKRDLKSLLLELRANIIFCVDYDSHADHRALSVLFEEVMGEILCGSYNYRPEVYKKFAYATAFTAAPDFYAPNLLSTLKPKVGVTDTYDFDLIDRANYIWAQRVRFPIPEHCRKTLLKDNPIANAIFAHKSQRNEWNALRILNSDEVFFERRTDSQTYFAHVSASSGNPDKVRDFKIIDTTDINACPAKLGDNLWQPDSADSQRQIFFDWDDAAQVRRIVIYGNAIDDEPAKISVRLDLVNDSPVIDNTKTFDAVLPAHGCPLIIDTDKFFVKHAEITIVDCGVNFGLAEVEFFANTDSLTKIAPFIKLTVADNFFYHCAIPNETDKISVGLYRFHVDAPVKITATTADNIIATEIVTDDDFVINFGEENEIVLTAEVVGSDIYDRAVISRVGDLNQIQLKIWQWLDKLRVHKIRKVDR